MNEEKEKPKITREEYERVKQEYLSDKNKPKQQNSKRYFKFGKRRAMNKSIKKPDLILVFLLNLKKQIEGPILTKIYGGNFLVVRNHVYRYNPDRVFSFGKYKAVIAREFDRELVGIDDYEDLITKDFISKNPGGRVNIDDPVLIKALIAAKLTEKPVMKGGMKWIIIILIILGAIVGFVMLSGKKTPAAEPVIIPPTPAAG